LGAYAHANLSTQASRLYYARSNNEARGVIRELGLQYVFVDARMTEQIPVTGSYFFRDVNEGRITRPLDLQQVSKFDHDDEVDRIYDNGVVRGYRVSRVWND
jgi:hypothetical protein